MNFLKTFIISLVIYLGLNSVFMLVAMFTVVGYPATDVWYIIVSVFAPIATYPGAAWVESGIVPLLATTDLLTDLMFFLSLVVPPFVAILVASLIGDNNLTGFGAWFLTAFLSCSLYAIFLGIGQGASNILYLGVWLEMATTFGLVGGIINIMMAGIVNGFFYGCICILLSKKFL